MVFLTLSLQPKQILSLGHFKLVSEILYGLLILSLY